MTLQDTAGVDLDPGRELVAVIFNGRGDEISLEMPGLRGRRLELHGVQQEAADLRVHRSAFEAGSGRFVIPSRTTAVIRVSLTEGWCPVKE